MSPKPITTIRSKKNQSQSKYRIQFFKRFITPSSQLKPQILFVAYITEIPIFATSWMTRGSTALMRGSFEQELQIFISAIFAMPLGFLRIP